MATALAGVAVLAADAAGNPQRIINMVTYVYDRPWPPTLRLGGELALLGGLAAAAVVIPFAGRRPGLIAAGLAGVALLTTAWCVQRYLPAISGTWSQRGIFEAYHADCTPADPPARLSSGRWACAEPLIAYKMFWRGETWHSGNTVVPLRRADQVRHFLDSPAARGAFYVITEHRRVESQFSHELAEARRPLVRTVHADNAMFVLVHVPAAATVPREAAP